MTMTDQERIEFLAELGLNDSAKPTPVQTDPHNMPATDIVFDPADVAEFPNFDGMNRRYAADKLFLKYKSEGRNKDSNSLVWSRIGKFLTELDAERKTGGIVKEQVKTTKEQREIAQLLASQGITLEQIVAALEVPDGSV